MGLWKKGSEALREAGFLISTERWGKWKFCLGEFWSFKCFCHAKADI